MVDLPLMNGRCVIYVDACIKGFLELELLVLHRLQEMMVLNAFCCLL